MKEACKRLCNFCIAHIHATVFFDDQLRARCVRSRGKEYISRHDSAQ